MVRKLAAAALALVFFGPAMGLIGIGVLMNPAAAYCANQMCIRDRAYAPC